MTPPPKKKKKNLFAETGQCGQTEEDMQRQIKENDINFDVAGCPWDRKMAPVGWLDVRGGNCGPSLEAQSLAQWGHWNSAVETVTDTALWPCSRAAATLLRRSGVLEHVGRGLATARSLLPSFPAVGWMSHHQRFPFSVSL